VLLTPGFWLLTSALTTNEAGMLRIIKDLIIYVGIRFAGVGWHRYRRALRAGFPAAWLRTKPECY
jgi:hypothetical protein